MPDPAESPRLTIVSESPRPDRMRGLAVFLHGWTGDEHSMEVLDAGLAPGWWRVAPRAPFAASAGGYSWSSDPERPGASLESYRMAIEAMRETVDRLDHASEVPVVLVGFSQGSAVALGAAAAGGTRPAGVAVLSGFLPTGCEPRALSGLPVFWSHGIKDPLVSVDRARADSRRLELGGARLTYCEADVGHKVGLPCVRGLRAWLIHLERDSKA